MKRYNKVKAGCDDRKKTGRHAAMDKDKATEFVQELLAETRNLKMVMIAEKLSERFGVDSSATWVCRLMKQHGIPNKEPRPPKIKKVRAPTARGEQIDGGLVQQYPLPSSGQYPSFRDDLQQASTAGQTHPHPPVLDGEHPAVVAPPPPPPPPAKPAKRGRSPHLKTSYPTGHAPEFEGFGILKLHNFVHEFETLQSSNPTTPKSPSPRALEVSNQISATRTTPHISTNWEVLKVVELP